MRDFFADSITKLVKEDADGDQFMKKEGYQKFVMQRRPPKNLTGDAVGPQSCKLGVNQRVRRLCSRQSGLKGNVTQLVSRFISDLADPDREELQESKHWESPLIRTPNMLSPVRRRSTTFKKAESSDVPVLTNQ